jgi:glutamine synthetase
VEAPMLPTSLRAAVGALVEDTFYRKAFGDAVVDYLIQMKRAELARYDSAIAENPPPDGQDISDWEMREYFEFY